MKIIDKYLIKQFLQTIIFGLIAFTIIFIVIDVMENLDDFIDQDVPTFKILHYYFVFAPDIIKLMIPVAGLFAALFTVGKASSLSELTAMRASGMSVYRFMVPFVITAFGISLFAIYFGGFVVPQANKTKIYIARTYLKKGINFSENDIYFQDSKTIIVSVGFFDAKTHTANRVSIQEFNPNAITQMVSRIDMPKLTFDTLSNNWLAINGVERFFNDQTQNAKFFDTMSLNYLNFKPEDITKKQRKNQEMDLNELDELIATQIKTGNDPTATQIEFHSRFSFALTSLIVVLFGLPLSVNKRKGSVAVQVGISILVTFIYLVFMKISEAFGKNGSLDPLLTAWFANALFILAAIYIAIKNRF